MFFDKYLNRISGNKRKVVTNVFWALLGKIVTMLSTLIVSVLVARYLGPQQFGVMNYVVSVVSLFSIFATFGMSDIVVRELSKKEMSKDEILGTAFILRLILSSITITCVIIYALLFENKDGLSTMTIIYSIFMLFACFDVIRNYFTSIIQNKRVVISEISRSLIGALIKIALVIFNAPLILFIAALAADYLLLALGYFANYQEIDSCKNWKYNSKFALFLLKSSFPLLIAGAAATIYQRIDQVMIAKMIDNASVGYFSTALSFVGVLVFIPIIMIQTVGPILVDLKKNNPQKYEVESQKMMNMIVWATIIVCVILSLLSYPIIYITYGIKYLPAVPVMQILVFKAVGIALTMTGGQLIIIENIHKFAFVRNILACVVCVISNYLLIPHWGIIGSAWATIITAMFSGGLGNLLIPPYHHILKKQCLCVLFGWKDLLSIKSLIKSKI